MRATRAYIAGFGTAGSLLAGAAMVFVLASALVAFRGWPQVGSASSASTVIFGKLPRATPSGVDRQLVAAAAVPVGTRAGGSGGSATHARSSSGRGDTSVSRVVVSDGQSSGSTSRQSSSVAPPPQQGGGSSPSGGCASSCGSTPTGSNPVTSVIHTATGAVGNTVSSATQTIGSTVSGVAKVIATKLGLNGALGQTSSAAGSVLSGAGGVVSGAGKALGGLLGGQ